MMDEKFARGNSVLHRRNPRVKIIVAVALVVVVAISNNFITQLLALALAFFLVLVSKLSLKDIGKRLLAANSFTFFLWITLPLTYGGDIMKIWGYVPLSLDGINLAGLITLKTNTIVLSLITLLGTSRIVNLGHALERLHFPSRLCFLLLFSYRYIFVIYQEYQKLHRAAQMRCFSPSTNLHTYRTYGYLFGMTLVKSYNRAIRVQQAMMLRAFDGRLIPLHKDHSSPYDFAFLILLLSLILTLAFTSVFL